MSEDPNHPDQDSQVPFEEPPADEGLGNDATAVDDTAMADDSWPVDDPPDSSEDLESIDAIEPVDDSEIAAAQETIDDSDVDDPDVHGEADAEIDAIDGDLNDELDDEVGEEFADEFQDDLSDEQDRAELEAQPELAHDIDAEFDDEAGIDPNFEELAEDADEEFQDASPDAAPQEPPAPTIEAQRRTARPEISVEPLPTPGGYPIPPSLTICRAQQALQQIDLNEGLTLLGTSENDDDSIVDLSPWLSDDAAPHRYLAVFKQQKNITLWVLADEPAQLNDQLLELGQRAALDDGDIIVLGSELALRLDLDLTG